MSYPVLRSRSIGGDTQEDLNLGNLRFVEGASFDISFTTNSRLYGQYLFILSALAQLVIIDVTNPFGPFLAGMVSGISSAFNLRQGGNNIVTFENNRLRVYDVSDPGAPVLLYGPTLAAGNVGSSTDGDLAANYVYGYRGSSSSLFQVVDISDPTVPRIVSTAATTAYSGFANTSAFDNNICYSSANGVIQAYDVSNPESIVLLSTLDTTLLSENIDRVYAIKPLGSFLYCNAKLSGTNEACLLIINKTDPTAMFEESLTLLDGLVASITPNLELFFPFVALNAIDTPDHVTYFYDVRQYDAPELKQFFYSGYSTFNFSLIGNNYYETSFAGVVSFILFGTNVSNAVAGTIQAGTVAVYGEVAAGRVNVRGDLTCRNNGWFQNELYARESITQEDAITYRYRPILRYIYMMS